MSRETEEFMNWLWRPSDWLIRPGMPPEYVGPVKDGQPCPNPPPYQESK